LVTAKLEEVFAKRPDLVVVSGGAEGPDSVAETWAKAKGVPTEIFPADFEKLGKTAGIKRNAKIVQASEAMMAFWDGTSAGTLDSICRGKKKKDYPVLVYLA
jgi:ribosomal protein L7Ae-like RNA K-turn-binding protein